MIHVVGELSHKVIGFDLSAHPTGVVSPIHGFDPNVIPSNVHLAHQYMMDAAEIYGEGISRNREPHLTDVPDSLPSGDSIAIILLSGDGRKVEGIKHVLTDLDVIRGMRISDDGKYVVAVGQVGGGVEVYSISGDRADVWTRVARLNEGLESGIKHAVWL
ncbi:hypothetical protein LTR64_005167 [Lithohypha guttulata]|uniref:uncharacterized protein n=1 Tax=Lithohypha guttulata TaxID=1690604 RepID=UPI002DDE7D8A|nr:hypothetical protein LTR51_003041 [Lithohypha guttulata]